jgi:hypothetical protein
MPNPDDTVGSITVMIHALRAGDRTQKVTLCDRYLERLSRVAHPIVRFGPPGTRGTEEDAAISAINAFCDGIARGQFDYVSGREVLWSTLAKITERKAMQQVRRWKREVLLDDLPGGSSSGDGGAGRLATVEPTPEYKALVNLALTELIDLLDNPLWRQAVLLVLDGYGVPEIAARLGRSRECVYVWFRTIRKIWEEHLEGQTLLS